MLAAGLNADPPGSLPDLLAGFKGWRPDKRNGMREVKGKKTRDRGTEKEGRRGGKRREGYTRRESYAPCTTFFKSGRLLRKTIAYPIESE